MAIFLGKQILGQRDKMEQTVKTPTGDSLRIEAEAADRNQAILLSEIFLPEEIAAAHERLRELELQRDHGQTTKVHRHRSTRYGSGLRASAAQTAQDGLGAGTV
jgi:hypothetical protein